MFDIKAWFRQYSYVLLALVGNLTLHGVLLLAGSYRGTYDAYVHIFFADHYRRYWWNLWETRWYTGFTMVSYPPLTHQLIALISYVSGLTTGFVVVMLSSVLLMTIGVYRFSRLWVNPRAAGYAALLTVFSSSIVETVHVFGQLPTMFVMGVMLNALPFLWAWLETGKWRNFFRACALLMVAAAGHHVTTLFGMIFFSGPVIATVLLQKFRTPRAEEPGLNGNRVTLGVLFALIKRRIRRFSPAFVRAGIFGVTLIFILVLTVLPYWLWSKDDPITQISIPHASRDSFLVNQSAGLVFFLIPWGIMLFVLPYAFYKGFGSRNWILAGSLAACFVFGTGGTTPIPAFVLKGAYYILTLDRFTFWGSILILPFAGLFVESLLHGRLGQWIGAHLGDLWRYSLSALLGLAMVALALFVANLTQFRRFQPDPIDMTPIVEFLAKDNHDHWRYLTLGFGDQMAWLSAQTTALDVEGNYHSARRLPEMTSTPVERMDGAKYTSIPGLGSLQQFVTNPEKYNLKYIFAKDAFYEPLLYFGGWHRLQRLDNDVVVWERADIPPLPAAIPVKTYPVWQRLMWGILPVGSIVITLSVFFFTGLILPRIRRLPRPIAGLVRRVTGIGLVRDWLLDSAQMSVTEPSEDWQLWRRLIKRLFPRLRLEPIARRALYGTVLLGTVLAAIIIGLSVLRKSQISPQSVLLAYYDDIDFKRFTDSYRYLQTDLSLDAYMRWLSLRGGIVASYGKLNNLFTNLSWTDQTHLTASVTAEWVTSLGTYPQAAVYDMVLTASGWRIVLQTDVPPVPRETFVTTGGTNWFINLPISSIDETALVRGVLDRALLSAGEVSVSYLPNQQIGFIPTGPDAGRKGRFTGLLSISGMVTNLDPYPADVTVTAIFRDAQGNRIAQVNAMDMMIHQLLPGETTPFRVDLLGAEATQILNLDSVSAIELNVKGVPTAYNLDRPLVVIRPGVLYNVSTVTVDIPRILHTYLDGNGHLTWVSGMYLEQSLNPDQSETYKVPDVPLLLEPLNIPVTISGPRLQSWTPPADVGTGPITVVYGFSR